MPIHLPTKYAYFKDAEKLHFLGIILLGLQL